MTDFYVACGIVATIALLAILVKVADRRRQVAKRERTLAVAREENTRHQAETARQAFMMQQAAEYARAENARREAEGAAHAARMHAQMLERAAAEKAARRERLTQKFGAAAAEKIERHEIWQGATVEMLVESRGTPAEVDERVMATKTKHVYKYDQFGKNRFRLRITIENGIVVGWEEKN